MPDVDQARDLELPVAERRPNAAGPIVVRVHNDARVVVLERVPVAPDVQRALGLAGAERAHVGPARLRHGGVARQAAPEEAAAQVHGDRLVHHRDLVDEVADRDELLAAEGEHGVAIAGPLQADLPAVVRLLERAYVQRRLPPTVPHGGGVRPLLEVTDGGVQRLQQDDVLRLLVVPGDAHIGPVLEEAEVHARLELFGALRLQDRRRPQLLARHQAPNPSLRRGVAGALSNAADDAWAERRRGEIRLRLRARFAIGDPQLAVREPRTLADRLRELPRRAPLGEPAAQVLAPERRGAVVANGRRQVELALDVERGL